jgi:hypothetical protein
VWHRTLWAIDHGAALVFQHAWPDPAVWATRRYPMVEHVLAPVVTDLSAADWDDVDAGLAAVGTSQLQLTLRVAGSRDWARAPLTGPARQPPANAADRDAREVRNPGGVGS